MLFTPFIYLLNVFYAGTYMTVTSVILVCEKHIFLTTDF